MSAASSISLVGTGSLGKTLAKALHRQGYEIKSLFNRTEKEAAQLASSLGEGIRTGAMPESIEHLAPYVFLAVPDDELRACARHIAGLSDDFWGYHFIHCSGHEAADTLEKLAGKGAAIAAFHPMQTFTGDSGPEAFQGIHIDIEVPHDESFKTFLEDLAAKLGAHPLEVSAASKPYLHAAAVMASNYLLALLHASGKIALLGGIPKEQALEALMPLMRSALANADASSDNISKSLTGPIRRGDVKTVRAQLELLQDHEHFLMLYRQLGREALELAREQAEEDDVTAKLDEIAYLLQP